ncbi:TauD/TfdA family dioxygenase [Algiphilus sp.]|uniref:TauD/TfdA family dioxygenase n=1 Tax=Algiphilus sp. TaxID=1872431 RepID=UPI003BAAF240
MNKAQAREQASGEPLDGHLPQPELGLPLVITASAPNTALASWLEVHRKEVMAARRQHGALCFRGFAVDEAQAFEDAARVIAPDLQCEYLGQSPRRKLSNYVFTSSELPPHYPIPQHAEMSFYYDRAPHSLFFWCATASRFGGATPLTDLRRVVQALDPEVREAFEQRGVRHIRAYEGPRAKRSWDVFQFKRWHEVYGTEDKAEVERIAAEAGDEVVWGPNDRLTLYSTHPAFRHHPETGELAWFNHSQVMHLTATPHELFRQARLLKSPRLLAAATALKAIATAKHRLLPAEKQSYHVTFADGGEIPARMIRHVCDVIWDHTVVMPWQRGDVLAIDNASVAHGRMPFRGERLVAVAWA